MKLFSFGGGVQSMAVLILSAQGKLDYTDFIFANVGDDSENPKSLEYIKNVAIPFANNHGLKIIEVSRQRSSDDKPKTLYQELLSDKYITIPVYLNNSGPQSRSCTTHWKINVINKYAKKNCGATKKNRIEVGVGISTDESHRMRTDDPVRFPYTYKTYPLIDLMLTRAMCHDIIFSAGLPIAPKSSCYFCPYKKPRDYIEMHNDNPELFAKAVALENQLNAKIQYRTGEHGVKNKHVAYLTPTGKPLINLIDLTHAQMKLDGIDDELFHCESGYCMT